MPILETKDYKRFIIGDTPIEGADKVNKALPGDNVEIKEGIVSIMERATYPQLVGTIELTSKCKYGFTSRGVPIYLFNPTDESYPQMMVGCSERDLSRNRVCLVQFASWDDVLPRANLIKILGPAGDTKTELEALYWRYSPWSAPSKTTLATLVAATALAAPTLPEVSTREDLTEWPTINIDPPDCRDIDDVISMKQCGANEWLVAISIADVGEIVKPGSALDQHARRIGQTLYQTGSKPRHMLPAAISEDAGSLTPGQKRPAISLIFKWSGITCTEHRLAETIVLNKQSYTYETVVSTVDFPLAQLATVLAGGVSSQHDSHKWVETLMIYYNKFVAGVLHTQGEGLLRHHETPEAALAAKMELVGLPHLAANAAKYVSIATGTDTNHAGLDCKLYCHATSPLRRYADIVNQWIIKKLLRDCRCDLPHLDEIATRLNKLQRAAKAHDRDVAFVSAVARASHGRIEAIVLDEKRVYVEEWKTIVRFTTSVDSGTHIQFEYFCDMRQRAWKHRMVLRLLVP